MSRKADLLLLLGLLFLAGVAGVGFTSLGVDRENRSMRSEHTAQAEAEALREKAFGAGRSLLFMLEPLRPGLIDPVRDPSVPTWIEGLRGLDAVERVAVLPQSGTNALYLVVTIEEAEGGRFFDRVQATVDQALAHLPAGYHFHATGQALGELAISSAMTEELGRIVPILLAALFVLLWATYRHVSLAVGTLASALLGILVLGGIQWLLGLEVDPITSLLPPVLLTVGVAGSVHLIEAFLKLRASGRDAYDAVRQAVRELVRPAALTISTTAAGFLALAWSPIPAVRDFGLLAALGVSLTCGLTFLWLPAFLRVFAGRPSFARIRPRGAPWRHVAGGLALWLSRHARAVTVSGTLLVLLFAWQWTGLSIDTEPLRLLPERHPFRRETERVALALGGVASFDVLLPGGVASGASTAVDALRRDLAREPLVADVLGLPERAPSGLGRQRVLLRPSGTGERARLFSRVEDRARTLGWKGAVTAGPPVIEAKDSNDLVAAQLRSMGITLLFLGIAMAIGLRSLRLGLLGLIPNVVPAVLLYGGLSLAGRPLSVGSAMIGSVLLGLTVDDSIHFLYRYREARKRGSSRRIATARSFRIAGRALLVTTLVEALGFLVCIVGSLESSREFAVLSSSTMAVALAADVIFLPSLLLGAAPRPARS